MFLSFHVLSAWYVATASSGTYTVHPPSISLCCVYHVFSFFISFFCARAPCGKAFAAVRRKLCRHALKALRDSPESFAGQALKPSCGGNQYQPVAHGTSYSREQHVREVAALARERVEDLLEEACGECRYQPQQSRLPTLAARKTAHDERYQQPRRCSL